MTRSQQAFFLLLRSGLWEHDVQDLSLFPLTDDEWEEVFFLSEQQTVQGLVFQGLQRLPAHLSPPQTLIWRWITVVARLGKEYRQFTEATMKTCHMLEKAGVMPILQKGLAVAHFYEHPELRLNGDIDWYVPQEQSFHLSATTRRSDGSICFEYEGIDVEIHREPTDLIRPRHQRVVMQLMADNACQSMLLTDDEAVRVMAPVPTLVMLNAHIMKHAFTVGVGLRQFCDMARAYHRLHGMYDVEVLDDAYRRTSLWRWSQLLHSVLVHDLGLNESTLPFPVSSHHADAQKLVRMVMEDGNFGHHALKKTSVHRDGNDRVHTVWQIIRRLTFSLRYAPTEMFYRILTLTKGVLSQKNKYKMI